MDTKSSQANLGTEEQSQDYEEIERHVIPDGTEIAFFCNQHGRDLDDVMRDVYQIAAEALRRKVGM